MRLRNAGNRAEDHLVVASDRHGNAGQQIRAQLGTHVGAVRLQQLLAVGDRIYFETHLAPLLAMQGAAKEIAAEMIRPDGSRLPVLLNAALRLDANAKPVLVRWTVFDATDRRAYERELLEAQRRAERAGSQLRELLDFATRLAALELSADIAVETMGAISRVTGATAGVLWLWSNRSGQLQRSVAIGMAPAAQAVLPATMDPHGIGPHVSVLRTRQPLVLSAEDALERFPTMAEIMAMSGHRTVIFVPLVDLADDVGVLDIAFDSTVPFDPERLSLLQNMAHQAARALHRARSLEMAKRAAVQASFIADLTRGMAGVTVSDRVDRLVAMMVGQVAEHVELIARAEGIPSQSAHADEEAIDNRGDQVARDVPPVVLALRVDGEETLADLRLGGLSDSPGFPANDPVFLGQMAESVARLLYNGRLFERERSIALTLQRSQLVSHVLDDPRVDVAHRYFPAEQGLEIGGDWYDAFAIGDGQKVVLSIGDVVGRGVHAAAAMGQIRSATRALAGAGFSPAEILDQLDQFVILLPAARYATMVVVELDLHNGEVRMASAGHLPALLVGPGDEPNYLWGGRFVPLGVRDPADPPRVNTTFRISAGQRLVLYTDGLIERRKELIDVGLARLAARATTNEGSVESFIDALCAALPGEPGSRDDVCLLVAHYRP